ncbi:hypothetical protein E2C01_023764 [Portunus trituberculatus]|uniref:Uncharacterized protein n=1 Tax=Portunus trituberculatus TaxID=210409 RepID=A0A5B7EAV0_PORTR|nr:hypothetical protein [Portunus trituberculatus]
MKGPSRRSFQLIRPPSSSPALQTIPLVNCWYGNSLSLLLVYCRRGDSHRRARSLVAPSSPWQRRPLTSPRSLLKDRRPRHLNHPSTEAGLVRVQWWQQRAR